MEMWSTPWLLLCMCSTTIPVHVLHDYFCACAPGLLLCMWYTIIFVHVLHDYCCECAPRLLLCMCSTIIPVHVLHITLHMEMWSTPWLLLCMCICDKCNCPNSRLFLLYFDRDSCSLHKNACKAFTSQPNILVICDPCIWVHSQPM